MHVTCIANVPMFSLYFIAPLSLKLGAFVGSDKNIKQKPYFSRVNCHVLIYDSLCMLMLCSVAPLAGVNTDKIPAC